MMIGDSYTRIAGKGLWEENCQMLAKGNGHLPERREGIKIEMHVKK